MILVNEQENKPLLSNVGQVESFTIKATAKSFRILADGLYANKIKAIIRELSCNAYDSHVAAGKPDLPFHVHLPNAIDSWFSIRDYGVGLDHNEVTKIFTTFFESTKTDSNDYVGALGLGSKSPFSYTNNFTVTAIKNGRKGVYTAFINDVGIPSIALMHEEISNEETGVEIKFSVENTYDFYSFATEASNVYAYFKTAPIVTGKNEFKPVENTYTRKNIIPGVHSLYKTTQSIAVMGNIAYPIDIPKSDSSFGDLRQYLSCGLEMHFSIGELDFQASREGLSYIPLTINAIKNKLVELDAEIYEVFKNDVESIENVWDKAMFISKRSNDYLWKNSVSRFIKETDIELFKNNNSMVFGIKIDTNYLREKFNIQIRNFVKTSSQKSVIERFSNPVDNNGVRSSIWTIIAGNQTKFVINNTKKGATARVKYHFKTAPFDSQNMHNVFLIEANNPAKKMEVDAFMQELHNPPKNLFLTVNDLQMKPKFTGKASGSGLSSIIYMTRNDSGRGNTYVWKKQEGEFYEDETYYYVELDKFALKDTRIFTSVENIMSFAPLSKLGACKIYGIRKNEKEWVESQDNWVELHEALEAHFQSLSEDDVLSNILEHSYEIFNFAYNLKNYLPPESLLNKYFHFLKDKTNNLKTYNFTILKKYRGEVFDIATEQQEEIKKMEDNIRQRYPLLKNLNYCHVYAHIADYVKMCDQKYLNDIK